MEPVIWFGVAVVCLLGLALLLNRSFVFSLLRTPERIEAGLRVIPPDGPAKPETPQIAGGGEGEGSSANAVKP